MHGLVERAPAKINLVLRVGAVREDSYHEVVSLMARVDLGDTIIVAAAPRTSVTCPDIPGGDTLVTRALHDFKHATGHAGGFHVGIAKRIPIGAGLGGGSSDAAAALRAANELCGYPLATPELMAIAAEIGSDVPFFLGPPVAIARGRGEDVTDGPALPACAVALAYPGRPLSTRDVYDAYTPPARLDRTIAAPVTLADLAALVANDLGPTAERLEPACASLRAALAERGAVATAVSGSGSAVFGLFADLAAAAAAVVDLPDATWAEAATLPAS
jgi:4-diphosphocytidyl-2-C-methyl-D-erythritol kinase